MAYFFKDKGHYLYKQDGNNRLLYKFIPEDLVYTSEWQRTVASPPELMSVGYRQFSFEELIAELQNSKSTNSNLIQVLLNMEI